MRGTFPQKVPLKKTYILYSKTLAKPPVMLYNKTKFRGGKSIPHEMEENYG